VEVEVELEGRGETVARGPGRRVIDVPFSRSSLASNDARSKPEEGESIAGALEALALWETEVGVGVWWRRERVAGASKGMGLAHST
jgi:hypothetical protein